MGYMIEEFWFHSQQGDNFYLLQRIHDNSKATKPPSQCVLEAFTPRVKWSGLEINYLSPSYAEVKNECNYIPPSPPIYIPSLYRDNLPSLSPLTNMDENQNTRGKVSKTVLVKGCLIRCFTVTIISCVVCS